MIVVAIVFQMVYGEVLRPPTKNELIKLMLLWDLYIAVVAVYRERLCEPFFLNCVARAQKFGVQALEKRSCCNMDSEQIVGIPRFQLPFARRLLLKGKCFQTLFHTYAALQESGSFSIDSKIAPIRVSRKLGFMF
jgi:hypothetical protein